MISEQLATMMASAAFVNPFRQIKPMTTYEYRRWLDSLGVGFQNWHSLHFLWKHGAVNPIAVSEKAIDGTPGLDPDRFVPTITNNGSQLYGDLGKRDVSIPPFIWDVDKLSGLERELWWHPFQLWEFDSLARSLELHWSLDTRLQDVSDNYVEWEQDLREQSRNQIARQSMEPEHDEFRQLLTLLLTIEPMVHGYIHGRISYDFGHSIEQYYDWRWEMASQPLLERVGLTLDQVIHWHEKLSINANLRDPLSGLRILVHQIEPQRLAKTKKHVLRTQHLYWHAETLRRHLEKAHDIVLFEEDDYIMREGHQRFKQNAFGSRRVLDGRRDVLRRIVRHYGIDHSERVALLLEGPTEVAFFETVAERWGVNLSDHGIVLYDLQGKDRLDKNKILTQLLQKLQSHEVFAYAALDEDGGGDHIRVLDRMVREGVLSAGYSCWTPDFESQNFTLEEIAQAATALARTSDPSVEFTVAEIQEEMKVRDIPVGKAVERVASRRRVRVDKGAGWGEALAEVVCADETTDPDEVKDEKGDRPAFSVLAMLIRGHDADYELSVEDTIRKYSV